MWARQKPENVVLYREEMREIVTKSTSSMKSSGSQRGHAGGAGLGGTAGFFDDQETLHTSESWSEFASTSGSESNSASEGTTVSRSHVPILIPVFGKELAHVQFRSMEEQLFRAMAVLFDQKQRQGVARLVNMNAPVSIYTPTIEKTPATAERIKKYLNRCYEKLPFALPAAQVQKKLADKERNFVNDLMEESADAPVTAKRRIR